MAQPNLAYAEVLTTGEDGLGPSLLLSLERRASYGTETTVLRRYLFDAPEEVVRFCGSHQLKLGKLTAVFTTSGNAATGLPELILAAAEQGLKKLHLRGPQGIVQHVRVIADTIAYPRSMQVLPAVARPGAEALCYEDDHLQVWALPFSTAAAAGTDGTEVDGGAAAGREDAAPPAKRAKLDGPPSSSLAVGYLCKLRMGGRPLVVLPCGASPRVAAAALSRAAGGGGAEEWVFHMGPRPAGAGGDSEIGLTDVGRRRGLWKSRERLRRWQILCPSLVPKPPPSSSAASSSPPAALSAAPAGGPATPASGAPAATPAATAPPPPKAGDVGRQQSVLRAYMWPAAVLEGGRDEEQLEDSIGWETQAECEEWGLRDDLVAASAALSCCGADGGAKPALAARAGEPEFLFLGTGSAKPTSRRGQSAILLRMGGFTALLDCGGGTWAQLVRLLGEEEALRTVDELKLIWLSHHHADHCAGLPTLLAQRTAPGLRVVATQRIARFWRTAVTFATWSRGGARAAPAIVDHKSFKKPADDSNWPSKIQSVLVPHCPESYALVLRMGGSQVVYSGDCRPSSALIAAAKADLAEGMQTWLVHEATFNPDEQENAIAVKHSTTTEALAVARDIGASGVLLTHFSQRYPSIKLEGSSDEPGGGGATGGAAAVVAPGEAPASEKGVDPARVAALCNIAGVKLSAEQLATMAESMGQQNAASPTSQVVAGAAFDGLIIRTGQMAAFGAARPFFEEYWGHRHEKTEKLRRETIPELRQPRAGALIPRACFQEAAATGRIAALPGAGGAGGACSGPAAGDPAAGVEAKREEPAAGAEGEQESAPEANGNVVAAACCAADEGSGVFGNAPLEARLRAFYLRFNPEKCADAPRIARMFSSKEHLLNDKLRARYDEDLVSQGLAPQPASDSSSSDQEEDEGSGRVGGLLELPAPPKALLGLGPSQLGPGPKPPPPPPPPSGRLQTRPLAPPTPPAAPGRTKTGLAQDAVAATDSALAPPPPPPPPGASVPRPPEPPVAPEAERRPPKLPPPPPGAAVPRLAEPPATQEAERRALKLPLPPPPPPSIPAQAVPRLGELLSNNLSGLADRMRQVVEGAEADVHRRPAKAAKVSTFPRTSDLQARLRAFYLQHNPEKAEDAANVARLFEGKEDALNERLRTRYGGLDLWSVQLPLEEELRSLPPPPPPPPANRKFQSSSESSSEEG